ncbi:alpha/beta fold hydrolase [Chachezhania sediminis]|uniref:alpha/beta fold hydrolase n=1 Tax=Chachezhania sediminis TaxID=2599291 RepID=UPI00131D76C3|nr:alpha/beta hydrolase [Chachezhania sediminis]
MTEPVVFLPGMMCDARLFAPQVQVLSARRATMIGPVTGGERVEEIASALLDQLPHRSAVVGHGLGAIVAMEITRRAPDRIARLCLMSAHPLAESPQDAAEREPLIIGARTGKLDEVMRKVLPSGALAPGPRRLDLMNFVGAMARDLGPEVFVRQSRALQRRRDQQPTLRKIRVPAMVLCGRHDTLVPAKRQSFMAELIPGARFVEIETAGHLPSLEAPKATLEALGAWLSIPAMA